MRRLLLIWLVLLGALVLAACGGGDDDTPVPTDTPTAESPQTPSPVPSPSITPLPTPVPVTDPVTRAQFRVVHASEALPALSIYLDGQRVGQGFNTGAYHQAALAFAEGEYLLRVVLAGENPDEVTPLLAQTITLVSGESMVVVLAGTPDDPALILYNEDLRPVPPNSVRLNVIHAVPDAPSILMQEDNLSVIDTLSYGQHAVAAPLDSGSHSFDFVSAGNVLTTADVNLLTGSTYSLIIYGDGASGNYEQISFRSPTFGEAPVRIIHASPDLGPVDIRLGDELLASGLDYRGFTGWTTFRALSYPLRVLPADDPEGTPLFSQQVNLTGGRPVDLVLLDTADRLRLVQITEDLGPTADNAARFTFIHAAPSALRLSVETLNGPLEEIRQLSFGTANDPVARSAGGEQFEFYAQVRGERSLVDIVSDREWEPGFAYTVVVLGDPDADALVVQTDVGRTGALLAEQESQGDEGAQPETVVGAQQTGQYRLRVVQALPNPDPIDVGIDGQLVFDSVAQGVMTSYVSYEGAPENITVSQSGALLLDEPLRLAEPARLTAYVYDNAGTAAFAISVDDDLVFSSEQARLRVVHVAAGQPPVQISRALPQEVTPGDVEQGAGQQGPTEDMLTDPVRYAEPGEPVLLPAETLDLRVLNADTGDLLLAIPDVQFEPGAMYDLLLIPGTGEQPIAPRLIQHPE